MALNEVLVEYKEEAARRTGRVVSRGTYDSFSKKHSSLHFSASEP
jgi:hypothetical protein